MPPPPRGPCPVNACLFVSREGMPAAQNWLQAAEYVLLPLEKGYLPICNLL
jgi:hypothetical protein